MSHYLRFSGFSFFCKKKNTNSKWSNAKHNLQLQLSPQCLFFADKSTVYVIGKENGFQWTKKKGKTAVHSFITRRRSRQWTNPILSATQFIVDIQYKTVNGASINQKKNSTSNSSAFLKAAHRSSQNMVNEKKRTTWMMQSTERFYFFFIYRRPVWSSVKGQRHADKGRRGKQSEDAAGRRGKTTKEISSSSPSSSWASCGSWLLPDFETDSVEAVIMHARRRAVHPFSPPSFEPVEGQPGEALLLLLFFSLCFFFTFPPGLRSRLRVFGS